MTQKNYWYNILFTAIRGGRILNPKRRYYVFLGEKNKCIHFALFTVSHIIVSFVVQMSSSSINIFSYPTLLAISFLKNFKSIFAPQNCFDCSSFIIFVSLHFLSHLFRWIVIKFYEVSGRCKTNKKTKLLFLYLLSWLIDKCRKRHFTFDIITFNGYHFRDQTIGIIWSSFVPLFNGISLFGGARGVMVIVVGNGHGDISSNPGRDWLHFT